MKVDWAADLKQRLANEALDIMCLINELRADEGSSVTLSCDNPEFTPNNDANHIEVFGDWTNWHSQHVYGPTLKDCLKKALDAKMTMEKSDKSFNDFLAERIKLAREDQGMSQEDLASSMGFKSRVTVSEIEAGRRKVHSEELMQFMRILNKDLDYLTNQISAAAEKAEVRLTIKKLRYHYRCMCGEKDSVVLDDNNAENVHYICRKCKEQHRLKDHVFDTTEE